MTSEGSFSDQTVSRLGIASGQLRAVQFSDTVLAISRDASPASELLVQLASHVLFLNALKKGVAIRGAIARGRVTADFAQSVFLGQPIIDAHRLEESQCWYGVALHPSARGKQSRDCNILAADEIPLVESYSVPVKGRAETQEMLVINWPVFADSRGSLVQALQPFDGCHSTEMEKLRQYHKNTRAFAEAMWDKYRA